MRKLAALMTVCLSVVFLMASAASAITLQSGAYEAKFTNLEGFFDSNGNLLSQITVGSENKGIFVINQIYSWPSIINTTPWYSSGSGVEITGYFYGATVQSITATASGYDILSSGGYLDIYLDTTPDFDGTIASATDGELMVRFYFTPGIITGDSTTTVSGSANALTNPLSGQAFAYLSVMAGSGAWADYFDGNAVPGTTGLPVGVDAREQSNFETNTTGIHPELWTYYSHDPVIGTLNAIPEPNTVVLLGIGLVGFASLGRRKIFKQK